MAEVVPALGKPNSYRQPLKETDELQVMHIRVFPIPLL